MNNEEANNEVRNIINRKIEEEAIAKEYYFITYAWKEIETGVPWEIENTVIDIDPVEWLHDVENTKKEAYKLLFYKEITAKKYHQFDGRI